jgi:flagellar protein FliJ
MRASKQLKLVQRVTDDEERRRAEGLAARERRVTECEAKLAELERYHCGYALEFTKHAQRGMNGARLREFQAFLVRLADALRQQGEIVERARADRDLELAGWRQAAQRADMVEHLVKRREDEERRAIDRQEQRESDERSLRRSHHHE